MKKKILISVSLVLVFVLLAGYAAISMGAFRKSIPPLRDWKKENAASDDTAWREVPDGKLVLANEKYDLVFDVLTASFNVKDKKGGNIYTSSQNAEGLSENDASARAKSELTILYYDDKSVSNMMNSFENSVSFGAYKVLTNENKIRVYYTFRKNKINIFAPKYISTDTMEQITSKLDSSASRRLKLKYTSYPQTSTNKSLLKKYPALEKTGIYVLNADYLQEKDYTEITEYMSIAGFDSEAYAEELKKLSMQDDMQSSYPEFTVPVEYGLTDNGFYYEILTDKITSGSDDFFLTDVYPLEYFSALNTDLEGYLFVPDGNGAILPLSGGENLSINVYGKDPAVESEKDVKSTQDALLPVYGQSNTGKGYFAIISGAEATARVNAATFGKENEFARASASFRIRGMDVTDIGKDMGTPILNLYSKHYVWEHPRTEFVLLADESNSYSDMAAVYRDYLKKNGALSEGERTDALPLYFDFTGYVLMDDSIVGVPVTKKVALSRLADILEFSQELSEKGVNNVSIRLKGVGNGGWQNKITDSFEIDRKVGTLEEAEALQKLLVGMDGKLYADADFTSVCTDSFNLIDKLDLVSILDNSTLKIKGYDIVTNDLSFKSFQRKIVTPNRYSSLAEKWYSELEKDFKMLTPSFSNAGSFLTSDFNKDVDFDRQMSLDAITNVLELLSKSGKIITDGGNAYTLDYSDAVLNLPLSSSGYKVELREVPFYSMVIHGYVNYAGAPINLSANPQRALLKAAETGAGLYYSFITEDDQILVGTDFQKIDFPNSISRYGDIAEIWAEMNSTLGYLQSFEILSHEQLDENVTVTEYADGSRVFVNYGDEDVNVNGVTVTAENYALIKGDAK
ncbi:MAG: hypothetical protein IKD04_09420 [Clostridia bacterium]|nr:hypothetical protein [Clostridia bacterium]